MMDQNQSLFVKKIWRIFLIFGAVLIAAEFFIKRKSHFLEHGGIDGVFGFYMLKGFVSMLVFILLGRFVFMIFKRKEEYYD
tara:strand:+ start:461 stop:703 length:243 start_codon:yes stop_codon:yes gene_type:complete